MAARGEALSGEEGRVLAYVHQVLLPQHPKAGLRSQRELLTIATGLDLLLDGALGQLGDLLAKRFKAIGLGRELGSRPTSGVDSRGSIPVDESRDRRGHESRASGSKAEEPSGQAEQIGNRRRGRKFSRDAIPEEEEKEMGGQTREPLSKQGTLRPKASRVATASTSAAKREKPISPDPTGRGAQDTSSEAEGDSEGRSWSTSASRSINKPSPEGSLQARGQESVEARQVREFACKVWELDVYGKSLSQMAVYLVKALHMCPGFLGEYAHNLTFGAASSLGTGESWKDLLPLPVEEDTRRVIEEVLGSDAKVKKDKKSGGAIREACRKQGIECLVYCMVVGLNAMWGGLRRGTRRPDQ